MLEIAPATPPAARCVVALHGLGASGADLAPLAPLLAPDARWLLPDAPVRPVSINMGMRMPAWYDIREPDLEAAEDAAGLEASAATVTALIAEQRQAMGLAAADFILVGFSQGAALALLTALRAPEPLGAVVALSGYLPLKERLQKEEPWPAATRFFLGAGAEDQVIPPGRSEASAALLRARGCEAEFRRYAGLGHGIAEQEIADARAFLAGG
ncbi:MAG: alpha/beta fold hydrolase [Betaproteobacteria bacterium AqS2]|uniref:Alpha/beta fold hydrolase n=1 Tax=Candidatus Amphirhobacter heronislandensis TaxID=1732024 RepID=A0A930Y1Z7_9GAMM|nr:alpha/beta fold hydrolase [Betaproteobacteria bacterium AqS2]